MAARSNIEIRSRRAWQFELGGRGNSYSDAAILKQRMRQLTWQFKIGEHGNLNTADDPLFAIIQIAIDPTKIEVYLYTSSNR